MKRLSYELICGLAAPLAALALESSSFSLDLRTVEGWREFPAGAAVSESFSLNLGGIFDEGAFVSSGFSIDLRESPRESAGRETLRYSATYDGVGGSAVSIGVDGREVARRNGSGSFVWTTNRVGRYDLTHTTYSGTTAVGPVLTASFIVSGPQPSIGWRTDANGTVLVQIDGSREGWTLRYTTNGSEPTSSSPVYSAPFAVQGPTPVSAKAFSSGGLVSETVTRIVGYEFEPEASATSLSARQRYPWNGLVDVDVAFSGTTGATYRVELSATDKVGGTNLTVATVWRKGAEGTVGNPVTVPAPGTHRLVWNAGADLPEGFVAERVAVRAKLLNPIWSFDSIPAIDPNDTWAPETVYHDVQTVVSYGEIESRTPTVRCLTDEWHLENTLGANVVFSGSSMALRREDFSDLTRRGVYHPIALYTWSDSTNRWRVVTLDYETGVVAYDNKYPYSDGPRFADTRLFTLKGDDRIYSVHARVGYFAVLKSSNTDISYMHLGNRWGDDEAGAAVCSYFPKGIPYSDASRTTVLSSLNKNTHAGIFFCGVAGTNRKQAVFLGGGSPKIATNSVYSCMKNPTGRYVVPLLDGTTYFTVGHGSSDTNLVSFLRLFTGRFDQHNGESFDLGGRYREDWPANYAQMSSAERTYRIHNWPREPSVAYSKGVAMPDGRRIFLGGAGRDFDGTIRMWQGLGSAFDSANYPAGHPFESWARRDVTCLLPNGKYCGVDEELGLVVVNPLTGEMYVASDDPVFKKGKMGCQLLPNGKVLIIPYDCEGREYIAGQTARGKLYEVDFGFTRSFSLSSLMSPYLKVAEGDPEPSGIKVGLDPNGGELPGVYAQYYKGANPVYGTLPAPTWSGHAFLGWSTDGTASGIVTASAAVPRAGILLKAVWRAQ